MCLVVGYVHCIVYIFGQQSGFHFIIIIITKPVTGPFSAAVRLYTENYLLLRTTNDQYRFFEPLSLLLLLPPPIPPALPHVFQPSIQANVFHTEHIPNVYFLQKQLCCVLAHLLFLLYTQSYSSLMLEKNHSHSSHIQWIVSKGTIFEIDNVNITLRFIENQQHQV